MTDHDMAIDTQNGGSTGRTLQGMVAIVRRQWIVCLLVAVGTAERMAWNALRPTSGASGEAMHIASAIGAGRGFADAYRVGQGPTAHMLPISPGIAGSVYRLLGVGSPASEVLLACWSIGLAMTTYCLLYRAFIRLGVPRWARIGALACGCLAPAYFNAEAVDFRVWDGGLAAMLMALLLERTLALAARAEAPRAAAWLGALTALLFFVNPPLGVAGGAALALLIVQRRWWRAAPTAATAALLVLALLVGPWAIRNHQQLGRTILLRDNAGLELALANYPGAAAGDHRAKFLARLEAIHPAVSLPAYDSMVAAGGEAAYAAQLGAETKRWMAANKPEVVGLLLLHLRQSLVPQSWQFDVFGRALPPLLRGLITDAAGVLGLFGLAAALLARRPGWIYPAVIVVTWAVLTSPFQPATRYTYLIYPLMLFCAAGGVAQIATRMRTPRTRHDAFGLA